jgi:hypothetical protein
MNAAPHFSLPLCGGLGRKADQAGRAVGTMKFPPFVGASLRAALLTPPALARASTAKRTRVGGGGRGTGRGRRLTGARL